VRYPGAAALAISIGACAAAVLFFKPANSAASAGPVLFVNETQDRKYDRALRASVRFFQSRTQLQLGIILKDELPGEKAIESFAAEAFKKARLGERNGGKALLFVWAEKERQFKIEVGYALEGVFPDALCRRLEHGARTFMLSTTPYARRDFLVELIVTMGLQYLEFRTTGEVADFTLPTSRAGRLSSHYLSGGAGIVGRGYASSIEQVERELVALPPLLAGQMQPNAEIDEVVRRYLYSLELGLGDPQLPLLTEASRYFRMEKPHSPGYLQRIRAYQSKGMPYRIQQQADLAVVHFKPGTPVLPIFLRRDEKGRWLVDEPKVWSHFHLYQDGSHGLKYNDSPYAFAATDKSGGAGMARFGGLAQVPPLMKLSTDLRQALRDAENTVYRNPRDPNAYKQLADLLHFELYWINAVGPVYEKVLELAPDRTAVRWRLIDIYEMTSDVDGVERQYHEILRRNPHDAYAAHYLKHLRELYD
jgi:uncharacterized protein